MVTNFMRFTLPFAAMLACAVPHTSSAQSMSTLDEELRLNAAITVQGDSITLGDVFSGYLSRPEKVVAQAPRPGQRIVLTAEWLADLARMQGLGWQPANALDRAVVYQPGVTITAGEITSAVKDALIARGMPASYGLAPVSPLTAVTVAANESKDINVREAIFDNTNRTFSAVVQISPNNPNAVFFPVRGMAYPTIAVPVLKEAATKNTTITAQMIEILDLPQDQANGAIITDVSQLVGKTPRTLVRAGQPVRENDVTQITLVDVPVLTTSMDRNSPIAQHHIKVVSYNAAQLPADAVTDASFLVGKSPRRTLAGGEPIRRADVAVVHQIDVPVAARDLPRGTTLTEDDISWIIMNEREIAGAVASDINEIIGHVTRYGVRAGQPIRSNSFAKAVAVERGQLVTILWSVPGMNLTAQGEAKEKGGVGDVIRVVNNKSKTMVLAEIIDSRTVRIASQQASR